MLRTIIEAHDRTDVVSKADRMEGTPGFTSQPDVSDFGSMSYGIPYIGREPAMNYFHQMLNDHAHR
tara:strand:+ start:77507 stop:77704 length:198 start_codon:yes stop_codon:yes gene_type:complete